MKIPAGISNGETLRVAGYGEAVQGVASGDLYLRIRVGNHLLYKREGVNLTMDLSIKLTDAILGMKYELKTLDGKNVEVKIPEGTNHMEMLRVRGYGVPSSRGRGDIIIRILVNMPTKLSKKAKQALEQLKEEGV